MANEGFWLFLLQDVLQGINFAVKCSKNRENSGQTMYQAYMHAN